MLLVTSNPRLAMVARIARILYTDDPAHGWPHVIRVSRWASRIVEAERLDVDLEILALGVILHDIARNLSLGEHHAIESARLAKLILETLGYEDHVKQRVEHIILAHSYSLGLRAETIEAMVLSDADKLDALGAIGIARVFHTGALMRRSFEESIEHFKEKILKLKDMLYFDYSKKVAENLTKRVQEYLAWWEGEQDIRVARLPTDNELP